MELKVDIIFLALYTTPLTGLEDRSYANIFLSRIKILIDLIKRYRPTKPTNLSYCLRGIDTIFSVKFLSGWDASEKIQFGSDVEGQYSLTIV